MCALPITVVLGPMMCSPLVTSPHHRWSGSTLSFCSALHCDCWHPSGVPLTGFAVDGLHKSVLRSLAPFLGFCVLIIFSGTLKSPMRGNRAFLCMALSFFCSLRKSPFSSCYANISIASYLMNMFHSSAAIVVFPLKKMPGFNLEQFSLH